MPPRKSTSSLPPADNEAATAAVEGGEGPTQATEQQLKAQSEGVSVEDLLLPRSVTQRLAKSVLPPNTTIQKDALLAIQKAATVFVSYLSSHANEATLKRTIAPSDILSALSELEFDSLRPRLERELDAHTEAQADKKRAKEKKAEMPSDINNNDNNNQKDGDEGAAAAVTIGAAEVGKSGAGAGGDDPKKKERIATIKGHKRVKRDSNGNERSADETEVEEADEDETEEEEEDDDDDDDDNGDEEEENEDVDENETQSAEDLDRVEDLDARMGGQDDDDSGSDENDDGPAAQLRSNMGLG
ncbi:hypothetical protein UA08_04488 [Talaromyces atroroseus]|uniref:DNA polymerase epsilon subunit D n=1 Tax=Talaromyces atroroseus TaxID=1441469 RepID=A0A225B047_TALAT|nr:hypothetical protein UA08_04488 [Talaromyces atroroseus]OKL60095.1 hypothetical protein UA08_04488 [Talaromyces atroroseus]